MKWQQKTLPFLESFSDMCGQGHPHKKRAGGGKIDQKSSKDMILTSYHVLLSFKIMKYKKVHEAILNKRGKATQVDALKMSLPKALLLQTSTLLLLSIITILSKVFNNAPSLFISGMRL